MVMELKSFCPHLILRSVQSRVNGYAVHEVVYDVVGEVDDISTVIRLVTSGIALSPLPVYVQDNPSMELNGCAQVMPGQMEARYGMFFDERRFNLRTALDIFELLKGEIGRMPPHVEVATRTSLAHQ